MDQKERALQFAGMHRKGEPVILFNIWDAGSAKALVEAGAKALATGSWSVAAAHGIADGEQLPIELVLANLRRIVTVVELPVSLDFESGYGRSPEELKANISRVIGAGAIGINFEDQVIGGTELYTIEEQSSRIRAIREEATRLDMPLFINARCDVFLKAKPPDHSSAHVEDVLRRCEAYRQAGASGFFPPGVRKPELIESICRQATLPVNILAYPEMTVSASDLARLGVSRISHGPFPYRMMMEKLKGAARAAFDLS